MLSFSFIIAILIEIVFPFVLAFILVRKLKSSWALIGIGALIFIASQLVHFPLVGIWNTLLPRVFADYSSVSVQILNAVVLGLLAGLCEETARWIGYRILKQRGKTLKIAVALGAGHGGIESVLFVGIPVLATFIVMNLVRSGVAIEGITPGMTSEYFSMSWLMPFVGAGERLMAIVLHITLSVAVWFSVTRHKPAWFWGALAYHALVDALVVALASLTGKVWMVEVVLAVFTAFNIYFLSRIAKIEALREVADEMQLAELPLTDRDDPGLALFGQDEALDK